MGRRCAVVTFTLSDRAARWLKSQDNPTRTIERLIELAADPLAYLSLKIAKSLNLPHPDRASNPLGAPVKVSDEALICLSADGLIDAEIARRVGLSRGQVGKRLKRIKKERNQNEKP